MWTHLLALKYNNINKNVDGKCYFLAVPILGYYNYMSNTSLSKSNIQITVLYLAHSIKKTIFSLYFSGIYGHLQSARTLACGQYYMS
jgi:hypothetical protein